MRSMFSNCCNIGILLYFRKAEWKIWIYSKFSNIDIVDTVIEKYPDVREEEILNILRNTKNNKNILKKYGYLDNENYIKKLEDEKNVDRKINILYISIFGIVIILIVIYYNNKKRNQNKRSKSIFKWSKQRQLQAKNRRKRRRWNIKVKKWIV